MYRYQQTLPVLVLLSLVLGTFQLDSSIYDDGVLSQYETLINIVDNAVAENNLETLDNMSKQVMKLPDSGYEILFLKCKTLYHQAFLRWYQQGRVTDDIINESGENPGLLNRMTKIGEKAVSIGGGDPELYYYMARAYWKLIRSPDTFFRYKERMSRYERLLEKEAKGSWYHLLYAADFHSTFSKIGGANRAKGEKYSRLLLEKFPGETGTLSVLSRIAESDYRYNEAYTLTARLLEQFPGNVEANARLDYLSGFRENRRIESIEIVDSDGLNRKVVLRFIPDLVGGSFTAESVESVRKSLSRYRLIRHVKTGYRRIGKEKVILELYLTSDVLHIVNLNTAYEAVFDQDDIMEAARAREGIRPPVFYYRNSDMGGVGLFDYYAIAISGIRWETGLDISFYETVDLRIDFKSWTLPVLFSIIDNSPQREEVAKINYLFVQPGVGLVKKIARYNLEFALEYHPRVHFMLFDSPDSSVPPVSRYTRPPVLYTMHNLSFSFTVDYISNLEQGWVREGFQFRVKAEWLKMSPDVSWSFSSFKSVPTDTAFRFTFYGEYSKFIARRFYFSIGFHYGGGINVYKQARFEVGKSVIGTPFGYDMKVHGFDRIVYAADHLFLLNSLTGIKINRHFHFGWYFDGCAFFESVPGSYLVLVPGTLYGFNIITGIGTFFKFTPGWLFDIVLEGSFGIDTGVQRIHGPVIGLYLQKTIVLSREMFKKKGNG
jgi:hypothetical protein